MGSLVPTTMSFLVTLGLIGFLFYIMDGLLAVMFSAFSNFEGQMTQAWIDQRERTENVMLWIIRFGLGAIFIFMVFKLFINTGYRGRD